MILISNNLNQQKHIWVKEFVDYSINIEMYFSKPNNDSKWSCYYTWQQYDVWCIAAIYCVLLPGCRIYYERLLYTQSLDNIWQIRNSNITLFEKVCLLKKHLLSETKNFNIPKQLKYIILNNFTKANYYIIIQY